MSELSHHCRKIIMVGPSFAVVIPPHLMDHLHAVRGDYLIFDPTVKDFLMLSKAPIPPYAKAEQLRLDQEPRAP